jgi:hypothetical protein
VKRKFMIIGAASLVGLSMIGAASPVGPSAFDLSCWGTSDLKVYERGIAPLHSILATKSFRIDIRRRLWCQDACDRIFRIAAVHGNVLDLMRNDHFAYRVDHEALTYTGIQLLSRAHIMDMMSCRRARFTGFPAVASLVG